MAIQFKKFGDQAAQGGYSALSGKVGGAVRSAENEIAANNEKREDIADIINQESMAEGREKDAENITKQVGGDDIQKGGGFKSGGDEDSAIDRSDMSSNASAIYRKKKGYNW